MLVLKTLPRNPLLVGSTLFFAANAASSFFSYFFQLLASRLLPLSEYGELVALFSAIGIITIPFIVINPAVVKKVSEYKANKDYKTLTKLFFELAALNLLFFAVLFVFFAVFSKQTAMWLNITDKNTILACSAIAGVSLIAGLPFYFLQGLLRFKGAGFVGITSSIFKLIFGIGGIIILRGVLGAFYGLILGSILLFIVSFLVLKKNLYFNGIAELDFSRVRSILPYAFSSILVIVPITVIFNMDTVFAKHYLLPEIAGVYSSVAVIGKIIFFGVSGFGAIVFPVISEKVVKGESLNKVISGSLKLYLVLLLSAVLIYRIFPEVLVNLLFGQRYAGAIPYLGVYSIYISFYSLISLFATMYLAVSKFSYGRVLIGGLIAYILCVTLFEKTILGIIYAGILSMGLTVIATVIYHYVFIRNSSSVQAGKNN
ncbi:hypothetical protein COT49_01790 [candidate division WWE3 bacterium CG08_land_8_20_14_0_20_40_13]|uniref:Polysaccharide biosynthesis protein C-terminal domain-containing protein n=1 Tax=candidate division WWE3 bacterium CG08_land_8_20_14_0_20_40_13 TaxID=1975084 RepID=A0A2H0XE83_UNCKA|nr:MAG: hypothetical protein COT49_01790 [candidate division WWE3 bacterium CG08_land_8_20_14_0_20_40_13]